MIVILNGPLGIGKTTLAEVLTERLEAAAMVDGDCLTIVNPAPSDALQHLHEGIELLVRHQRRFGYQNIVINHLWETGSALSEICRRLHLLDPHVHCFQLTLDRRSNLERIERRATVRAIDEREFECKEFRREFELFARSPADQLGEPFDVSEEPALLAERMLIRLGALFALPSQMV